MRIKSAFFPASSEPISFCKCSARAPSMVAISTTAFEPSVRGSILVIFWSFAARSISSIRLRSLLLPAGLSVPRPTAMRREHVGPEYSELIEILHRRCAIFLAAIVQLFLRLPNMNQYGGVVLSGERGRILQSFLRTGINGVRCNRGVNQRVALPALQEFFRVFEHSVVGLIVWGGKVEDCLAQNAAHAGSFRFLRDGILEIIHVRESRHTPANLLRCGQPCAPTHKLLGHILRFGRENEFCQPL